MCGGGSSCFTCAPSCEQAPRGIEILFDNLLQDWGLPLHHRTGTGGPWINSYPETGEKEWDIADIAKGPKPYHLTVTPQTWLPETNCFAACEKFPCCSLSLSLSLTLLPAAARRPSRWDCGRALCARTPGRGKHTSTRTSSVHRLSHRPPSTDSMATRGPRRPGLSSARQRHRRCPPFQPPSPPAQPSLRIPAHPCAPLRIPLLWLISGGLAGNALFLRSKPV